MLLVGVGEGELSQAMSLCVYAISSTLNLTAYNPILNNTVTMTEAECGSYLPLYEEHFSFERWIGPLFLEISEAYLSKCTCVFACAFNIKVGLNATFSILTTSDAKVKVAHLD